MSRWSPRTRILGVGSVAAAVAVVVLVLLVSGSGGPNGNDTFYLAMGDSLSVGIQPNSQGQQLKTDTGYTNRLGEAFGRRTRHLKLVEVGCPGETTTSLISGQGDGAAVSAYRCDRAGGSQLSAALAFIHAHRAHVKLVSLDIGANDLLSCFSGAAAAEPVAQLVTCVHQAEQTLAVNLPKILAPIRAAVAPGTTLVGGTIYDPFLVGYLSSTAKLRAIAAASVGVVGQFNDEITAADTSAGFRTANVAGQFLTDDTTKVRADGLGDRRFPKNLVVLCAFTYLCTARPQGPNIHPDGSGYAAMAEAYAAQLPKA